MALLFNEGAANTRTGEPFSRALTVLTKINSTSCFQKVQYYIEQLDDVPVRLISTKYHDDGEIEKGGIEAVRDELYRILSTSHRFEHSRSLLCNRLDSVLSRLRSSFSERRSTLGTEFDPARVREEIEGIRRALCDQLDVFGQSLGETQGLLERGQEAFFETLPVHLDVIALLAKEVLADLEKADLVKHWKTRRCGYWGYLTDLQARVADRVFPRVEVVLNTLRGQLDTFMNEAEQQMAVLQAGMKRIEGDRQLSGLEPIQLAASQAPMLENLRVTFRSLAESERDGIVTSLDAFVTQEVQERLDRTREEVAGILGRGTTVRQDQEVSSFYGQVRSLLVMALRSHLEARVRGFASAIRGSAESVAPHIRRASEGLIHQRLEAIESTLQVATEGKREQVSAFLSEMVALLADFAAEPTAVGGGVSRGASVVGVEEAMATGLGTVADSGLVEQHYEISENATGYTYERIFRPYIDGATSIRVEDPYIRSNHQVDNFTRLCAMAVRLGSVEAIELVTGAEPNEATDEADSRLETLRRDLQSRDIVFNWSRRSDLHDREVRFSNGWVVKIGRGLDIYHRPESWVSVEAVDFSMRRCRRTKVDVFRESASNG